VPFVENSGELIFFCASLIGSICAFLTFNLKPAKIFMGDVGSLAIGAVLGLIAIITKQEFVFFVISILFVTEAVSVILQVGSYKLRKKRIFLMAPIHHHFEKLGWPEQKVVKRFWMASIFFAALGMGIYF
jgi:phospho-N-acetylmuramoyl-pentapeptide-transferase